MTMVVPTAALEAAADTESEHRGLPTMVSCIYRDGAGVS